MTSIAVVPSPAVTLGRRYSGCSSTTDMPPAVFVMAVFDGSWSANQWLLSLLPSNVTLPPVPNVPENATVLSARSGIETGVPVSPLASVFHW